MSFRRYKFLLFAASLCFLYNDWLLGSLFNPRMSLRYSLISELSARTQMHHWAFQALDIIAGVLTLAALPPLWRFLRKAQLACWRVLFAGITAIGVDSIVDALMPISCAPSVDSQCNLATTHSLLTDAHMTESTLIGIVTFIAPMLWWYFCKAKYRPIAKASLWFVCLQITVGLSIMLTRLMHYDAVGTFQRIYQLGIGLWITGILYLALTATARRTARLSESEPTFEPEQLPTPALALTYEDS